MTYFGEGVLGYTQSGDATGATGYVDGDEVRNVASLNNVSDFAVCRPSRVKMFYYVLEYFLFVCLLCINIEVQHFLNFKGCFLYKKEISKSNVKKYIHIKFAL